MLFLKVLTFGPAVGYFGKALYDALVNKDLNAAGQSVLNALAVLGLGTAAHGTATQVQALKSSK